MKCLMIFFSLFVISLDTYAREVQDATVESVYTHDCCSRGPYTAVVISGGAYIPGTSACSQDYDNYFAIETTHPNHDAFISIALTALTTGKKVRVYGNRGGCIGPFNRADGITVLK